MKKLVAVLFALTLAACAATGPEVINTKVESGPIPVATATLESGTVVILYDTPCTNADIVAQLDSPGVTQLTGSSKFYQRGSAFSADKKQNIDLCYRNQYPQADTIFVFDAEGGFGTIDMAEFKPHQPL